MHYLLFILLIGEVVRHFFFGFSIWLFVNIPLYLIPFVGAVLILIFIGVDTLKNKQLKRNRFPLVLSFLEDVVTSILNGEIETTNERSDLFHIPEGFGSSSLSDGKEVMKMNDKLLFFTNRGVLDNFSGYVFTPNGVEPRDEDVLAKIVKKQRMSKNWYYISCT